MKDQVTTSGFSLMEIIVATAVFALLVVAVSFTIGDSNKNFGGIDDRQLRLNYAREAYEALQAIRDNSWKSIAAVPVNTSYDVRVNSSGSWELYNGTSTRSTISRNVYFYNVERDSSGNIVSSSGTSDYNTRKVVIRLAANGRTLYETAGYIGNTKSYSISQTSWSGTGGREVWAGTSLGSDLYSTSSMYTGSGNTLKLALSGAWYDASWSYRKTVTIDDAKVGGAANLTDFPVLISVTDTDLKATASGGYVGQTDGGDILFTSSDGLTKLSHEIEKYDSTTGELVAWVKVPTLAYSGQGDTVIYTYYGNASAADQASATNVWDSNFKMVQHLEETASSTISDSTSNSNNCTINNAVTVNATGKVNGGDDFDGSNDRHDCGTNASLAITSNLTVSFWFYADTLVSNDFFVGKTDPANWDDGYGFWNNTGAPLATRLYFYVDDFDLYKVGITRSASTWTHVVGVYDDTGNTVTIFKDGAQVTQIAYTGTNAFGATRNFYIGTSGDDAYNLDGKLDEVRVSNTARSSGWITTEYNNMSSPSTFFTIGSQTTPSYVASGSATSSAMVLAYATSPEILNRNPLTVQWAQILPSGCSLDLYLQSTNTSGPTFSVGSLIGPLNYTTAGTATTSADLSSYTTIQGKKWLRYAVSMTSCNSSTESPTLKNITLYVD